MVEYIIYNGLFNIDGLNDDDRLVLLYHQDNKLNGISDVGMRVKTYNKSRKKLIDIDMLFKDGKLIKANLIQCSQINSGEPIGVFPEWLFYDRNLDSTEKFMYSVYYMYTFKMKKKVCSLTNDTICCQLRIPKDTFMKKKRKLKELGYITTDGGIRTWALRDC